MATSHLLRCFARFITLALSMTVAASVAANAQDRPYRGGIGWSFLLWNSPTAPRLRTTSPITPT